MKEMDDLVDIIFDKRDLTIEISCGDCGAYQEEIEFIFRQSQTSSLDWYLYGCHHSYLLDFEDVPPQESGWKVMSKHINEGSYFRPTYAIAAVNINGDSLSDDGFVYIDLSKMLHGSKDDLLKVLESSKIGYHDSNEE